MNQFARERVHVDMGMKSCTGSWNLTFIQEIVESKEGSDGIGYMFQETHFEKCG